MDLKDIESKIINIDTNFPPVDQWNPPLCEGPLFKIDSNGDWLSLIHISEPTRPY